MNTTASSPDEGRRRRRKHSPEFKAHVVAACCKPGVSMASVAMANGVNANLVRRWVLELERGVPEEPAGDVAIASKAVPQLPSSFVQVPLPSAPAMPGIRIELQRGATKVVVTWPSAAVSECAAWMRELLR
ncbi:transposase [Variovorax sp. J22R24]|uniref:transposase n=1 Tax=Variovorax gracilis TaxID=3053502 RepID=UPI002576F8BA|nr:transposase [Variovorax sp. J22R24]MDM0108112.1 transposase [Variovorax sp. J22R24]